MRFDSAAQDLRSAIRNLRRAPGFALLTILTLAVGIGANDTDMSNYTTPKQGPYENVDYYQRVAQAISRPWASQLSRAAVSSPEMRLVRLSRS